MFVKYEDAKFKVRLNASIERHLIKQTIKKKIGKWIGKPYQKDPFLEWSTALLSQNPSSLIVDVGSNIGTTVLPLAVKFPQSQFFAIEPHPLPAARFIKNCALNKVNNVTFIHTAIGAEGKMGKIFTCPANSGGHRLTGFEGRQDIKNSPKPIFVPLKSMKSLFQECAIPSVDLLKIDTEGYELKVLQSLEEKLRPPFIKNIILEYGVEGLQSAGSSGWDLVSFVLDKGYDCRDLLSRKKIEKESDLPLLPDFCVLDLLFSPKDDRSIS